MTCAELNKILGEFSKRFSFGEEVSLYWSGNQVRWLVRATGAGTLGAAGDSYTEASAKARAYVADRKTELKSKLELIQKELETLK